MQTSVAEEYIHKFREIHEHLRRNVLKSSDRDDELEFERLPYFLNCAFRATASFLEAGRSIGMRLAPADGSVMPFVAGDDLASLCIHLESFFSMCVKAQNAFIPYFRAFQTKKTTLPASLNRLTKQLAQKTTTIDQWLDTALMDYWTHHGSKLRDYRDFAEHYALIFSTPLIHRMDTGVRIRLLLPVNPETKAPHNLVFTPEIHAVQYVTLELRALFMFADQLIAQLFSRYPDLNKHSVAPGGVLQFRPPLRFGSRCSDVNFCAIPEEADLLAQQRGARVGNESQVADQLTGTSTVLELRTATLLPVGIVSRPVPPTTAVVNDLSWFFAHFAAKTVVHIEHTFGDPPRVVTGTGTVIGTWGADPTEMSNPIIATAGHLLSLDGAITSRFRISILSLSDRRETHMRVLDFYIDSAKCAPGDPGIAQFTGAHHEVLDLGIIRAPGICSDGQPFFKGKPMASIMPTESDYEWALEGTNVAWAGFPETAQKFAGGPQLCYFEGRVSAFVFHDEYQGYLLDSPNVKMAIGGPVWSRSGKNNRIRMIGIICGYRASVDGTCMTQVAPIQHLCRFIKRETKTTSD
jgi:hypothetical protein